MSKFALAFLALFLLFIVLAVRLGPAWAFYLYELVYYLNPADRWWGNDIPNLRFSLYLVAFMALLAISGSGKPYNAFRDAPGGIWVVIIMLSFGVVSAVAVAPELHFRFLGYLVNSWITMLIAYKILSSPERVRLAIVFYVIAAAYIGWEAMNVGRDSSGRVEGIGTTEAPDANTIAATLVPCVTLAVYLFWRGNLWVKVASAGCGALIANGLVLINSRGAFLGVAISFAYFLYCMYFGQFKFRFQRTIAIGIVIAAALVAVRLVDDTFIERMYTLSEKMSIESTGSGGRRVNFWIAAIDLARDHPLGAGMYGYEALSTIYLQDETWLTEIDGQRQRAVHSIWFQALSEIGWLGMLAFIALLLSLFKRSQQVKKRVGAAGALDHYYMLVALQAGSIGFLVSSTFINMFRVQPLYWLIVFTMTACVVAKEWEPEAATTRKLRKTSRSRAQAETPFAPMKSARRQRLAHASPDQSPLPRRHRKP